MEWAQGFEWLPADTIGYETCALSYANMPPGTTAYQGTDKGRALRPHRRRLNAGKHACRRFACAAVERRGAL